MYKVVEYEDGNGKRYFRIAERVWFFWHEKTYVDCGCTVHHEYDTEKEALDVIEQIKESNRRSYRRNIRRQVKW